MWADNYEREGRRTVAVLTLTFLLVVSPFAGTVSFAGSAAAAPGDVVYRANAGGSLSVEGATWDPMTDYLVAGGGQTSTHGEPNSIDGSVPAGTPTEIWNTERWDPGNPGDGDEMQYEFSVPAGQQVEVRLYFYDGYSGTSTPGDRVFDVSVEGQTVENFDPIATYGDQTGGMESFTVTSDGTVDVDFGHVTENPQINAIEIVEAGPQSDTLGGPDAVDFGTVVTGNSVTETVTLTNLGGSGDADIDVTGVSVTGADASEFSHDFSGSTTLAPGESLDTQVTFTASDAQAKGATLEITHTGSNSPLTVALSGEGASDVPVGFGSSELQGFNAGGLTALEFGPDGRLYVAQQGGSIYALEIERNGANSYSVVDQETIDAINDIPNHDDDGSLNTGQNNRQVTGLTVGGTASQPVVYVSSSDPRIGGGGNGAELDLDTNSGTISRLTFDWNTDGSLASVDHDVMVLGLPRSEENHAPNGLDLSGDGETLYLAQGGNTNKGAPSNNFAYTPEYALSSAALTIDLAQIEANYAEKNFQTYSPPTGSGSYPDLTFYYAIPTIQTDDATDGDDLPFGGQDGVNQAKIVENGPVQVFSSGYRNPYDLVLSEDGQLYVIDNGPNGNWGGQPVNEGASGICTNEPNEAGSYSTGDQLHLATEGSYGGHAVPIRANPTGADIYDENGNLVLDIDESNSPVPASLVNPIECDYRDPTEDNSIGSTFGWTGGIEEYTASNFGGAMQGDLLVVEGGSNVERVELNAAGDGVTNQEDSFLTPGTALGIEATGDEGPFPGTVWTARGDLTVYEPNDYDGSTGPQCTGADDPSLDEDGDGYDNADEIDTGTDPCSSGSTPADFDDDGTSNLNDPDDDNDGVPDTSDPFAVDPDNGTTTTVPVDDPLTATSLFGDNSQSWTGLMTNGQDDYQTLYEEDPGTIGGAAGALLVENVSAGDATQNNQENAFQFGVVAPDEPFTVKTTVNGMPDNPENYQGMGVFVGNGGQDNYVKLVVAANGGTGGVQFFKEVDGTNGNIAQPNDANVTGPATDIDLYLTIDPTTDPTPNNGVDEVAVSAAYAVDGGQKIELSQTGAIPASWLDSSDGTGLAVGIISTSYQATPFDATWKDISVEYVNPPTNQPPTADVGPDQTVDEGATVQLDASGSTDPDGDMLGYSWTQTAGPDVQFDIQDTATPTFTAPQVDSETTLTFDVTVSDGEATDTDTVNVTVQDTDTGTAGDVVFAVNAGGSAYTAADGTQYEADATNQYYTGGTAFSTGDAGTPSDPEIGNTEDDTLYQTERYGDPFSYDVPVENGTYEVTLQFAEIYQGVSSNDGDADEISDRVFNASVEGQQVLTDYDIYAEVGALNATDKTYTVEVTDGQLDVDFSASADNAKISAIKVVEVTQPSDLTVAEAVASINDPADQIGTQEIQQAINWWATGSEVPNTGGETISTQEIQQLINTWATGATVGGGSDAAITITDASVDGDNVTVTWDGTAATASDHVHVQLDDDPYFGLQPIDGSYTFENVAPSEHTVSVTVADQNHVVYTNPGATDSATVTVADGTSGATSADVTVNAGSSSIGASTYGSGSFSVTNTGETDITSVSIDLSESAIPDAVFDPSGTAGDSTAKGLVIDSGETETGVVSTSTADVFSQPHDGNSDDGYDVLTVDFTDFAPGETVTFSTDIDPTTIKGASTTGGAGSISGLELSGSTVSVSSASETVSNDLFTDGSQGGSQSNVTASAPAAPTLGVDGVTLQSTDFPAHQAATVSGASQTLTLSGPAGATVELLTMEVSPPPSDGYDLDAFEGDSAEAVSSQTVTLDSNGEATVPVSLSKTNLNYFQAAVEDGSSGAVSQTVVLDYDSGSSTEQVLYRVNAGGPTLSTTDSGPDWEAGDGTYVVAGGGSTDSWAPATIDSSVPSSTPDVLFETERWDPEASPEMQYEFAVPDGTELEVRLYFRSGWDGASSPGDRVFNVSIEGQTVLGEYDIVADVGHDTGVMKSFTITSDGTVDIDFAHVTQNPLVNGIEIVATSSSS